MSPSSLLAFCMIQRPRLGGFVCLPETVSCQFLPRHRPAKVSGEPDPQPAWAVVDARIQQPRGQAGQTLH